jgi:SET domain-containing protein
MLLVPTRLGVSRIHGIGLFAAKPIEKGAVVWRFAPAIDLVLTPGVLRKLSPVARAQMMTYVYQDNRTKELILCGDDARFFNHARNPNVVDDPDDPYKCVARRAIRAGEELTQDYFTFDVLAAQKIPRALR